MTRDLYNLNLLAKLMVLHRQILFSLAIAAIAKAILMRISAAQVPSLHRVSPRYLKLVITSYFWTLIRTVGHDLALFCADFRSICGCCVYEPVGEVLKFKTAAAHKIDVVGKSVCKWAFLH